jgi:hypothetical protein
MFWRNWKRVGKLEDETEILQRQMRTAEAAIENLTERLTRIHWRLAKMMPSASSAAGAVADTATYPEGSVPTVESAGASAGAYAPGSAKRVGIDPVSERLLARRRRLYRPPGVPPNGEPEGGGEAP